MHHTLAYFKLIDNTANGQVNALSDQIIPIQNNNFLLQQDMDILLAYVGSATLSRARLTSPTLRQITQPQIRPINVNLLPPTDPNVMFFSNAKLRLRRMEEISLQATSGVAMTENCYGILCLMDRFVPLLNTDIVTLHATSTTAAVASTWTSLVYTLTDQLPAGVYALIGSEVVSATGIAHRWILDNQFYRPGSLSTAAAGNRTFNQLYDNPWGEWGRFFNTSLPRLEVLCNAADATHTIFIRVMKVG